MQLSRPDYPGCTVEGWKAGSACTGPQPPDCRSQGSRASFTASRLGGSLVMFAGVQWRVIMKDFFNAMWLKSSFISVIYLQDIKCLFLFINYSIF